MDQSSSANDRGTRRGDGFDMTAVLDPKGRALQRRTAAHYESYPFEFLTPTDEASIEAMQPRPFVEFINAHARPGDTVAEIGCGPGRGTMFLDRRGLRTVAVDISRRSLELARTRAPCSAFVLASNLQLPFFDSAFDIVVSDGVIHHTPDARTAFKENARILKPGGYSYLAVYRRGGYYHYIYTLAGPPIRLLESTRIGRWVVYASIFPIYYLAHLIKSRGKRSIRGARNFFYDYIITPRASFHSRDEIESWAASDDLDLVAYDPNFGNIHAFVFQKRDAV